MTSIGRGRVSRFVYTAALAVAIGCAPLAYGLAQTEDGAPFDSEDQLDSDMPHLDVQNVRPARQILLGAIQKMQADQKAGDKDAVLSDEIAVIDARSALIEAQITADQTRMPQAPADAQAMMQARDQFLRAEQVVGAAQRKLIGDQQTNNTGAFNQDTAQVNAARQQSRQARLQWTAVHAQIQGLQLPSDPQ